MQTKENLSQTVKDVKVEIIKAVLKNEFFSHLEVQNMLKIHAKILPLNIFKKIQNLHFRAGKSAPIP